MQSLLTVGLTKLQVDTDGSNLGHQFRVKAIQEIASAMTQLDRFKFQNGGALRFDAEGEIEDIGKTNHPDFHRLYKNMRSEGCDDEDGEIPFTERLPCHETDSHFLQKLDQGGSQHDCTPFRQGVGCMLDRFVHWGLPDSDTADFVLTHPDLDIQNILTSQDGTVTGIIDWDWVSTVPSCIGCLKYPEFLMNDYDPWSYDYDIKAGRPEEGCVACSPDELSCYRAIYAQCVENATNDQASGNVTRRSLVMGSLDLAASDPRRMMDIVGHLFDELERLRGSDTGNGDSDDESQASTDDGDDNQSENDVSVEHMTFKQLFDEIERLTEPAIVHTSSCPSTFSHTDPCHPGSGNIADPCVPVNEETSGPKFAKIACAWGSKKIRRVTKYLHKPQLESIPNFDNVCAQASRESGARPCKFGATQRIFGWTRDKFSRPSQSRNGRENPTLPFYKPRSRNCELGSRLTELIQGVQEKLRQLVQAFHRPAKVSGIHDPEKAISDNVTRSSVSEEIQSNDEEMKSACRFMAHLLKKNRKGTLTQMGQQAIARFLIKNLQPEEEIDDECGDDEEDQDAQDQARAVAYQARAVRKNNRLGVRVEENKEAEKAPDSDVSEMTSYDRSDRILTAANDGSHDDGIETLNMDATSLSDPGSAPDTDEQEMQLQENHEFEKTPQFDRGDEGGFTMWEICIALSKGDLDEQRTKRLKEGFLALLNQSM